MATLTGNSVASTYQSLIKISDNSTIGASLENLTDGLGNATALSLSANAASVSGVLSSGLFMNPQTVTNNIDIPANYNAFAVGPVALTGTVSVGQDSNLTIL